MIASVALFVAAFLVSTSADHDFVKMLKEDVFKKCAKMSCDDPSFMDKELECFEKLGDADKELILHGVSECYGVTEETDPHKLTEIFCADLHKSFECHKEIVHKLMTEHISHEKEDPHMKDHLECIGTLYATCLS